MTESPLLTLSDAAAYLSISRRSIYRLIDTGKLVPISPIGRARRLKRVDLDAHLDAVSNGTSPLRNMLRNDPRNGGTEGHIVTIPRRKYGEM